jgi:parvulin-like peptidyl-prolyl isomerase
MRHYVQSGLIASIVVGFAAIAPAQAPKTGQADPRSATKTAVPPRLAMLDQVVATVNGEPIIRDELYRILEATGTPPGASINEDRSIYQMTVDQLVNRLLLKQYLKKQAALAVTEAEIDKEFATFAEQFKKDGQDVNVVLASHGVTVAQVRDEMGTVIRYRKYIEAVANDANLKKFVADNKDVFNRTQVKASHILLLLEPTATAADKEKAKAKLLAIKQEIESKKITFADAANTYSEDESNKKSPRGGDLGYFERKGIIEPFALAAFAIKPGSISNVVETPYGMHLIQVTDRKEGTPIKFEENKLLIRNEYAADLHERIIASQKKTAKIKIEPMPADFFPKIEPPATATKPAADPARTATPGKAAAPR